MGGLLAVSGVRGTTAALLPSTGRVRDPVLEHGVLVPPYVGVDFEEGVEFAGSRLEEEDLEEVLLEHTPTLFNCKARGGSGR